MWAHPGKKLLFMGCEFAQNDEWSESAGLQWYLTEYDEHRQVQDLVAAINQEYKGHPALWERDTNPEGFSWIVNDDGAANTLAFTRWSDNQTPLVCITNFSPVPHERYRLRMPTAGVWREVLNTDDLAYGGSGVVNQSFAVDTDTDLYVELRIPPLATVWFERA
jgi:1,4-alpha-glucan branching enzyme